MASSDKEQLDQLLKLIHATVEQDEALRQKFDVGEKFRFVRDKLQELRAFVQAEHTVETFVKKDVLVVLAEDECLVYVYLYNAKGVVLRNWLNMLTPSVFYEYSVNRPIYSTKEEIESLLRSKKEKQQHAYLAVAVKKTNVLATSGEDAFGGKLLKVKEGSLKIEKLFSFHHNDIEYRLNTEGELVKK